MKIVCPTCKYEHDYSIMEIPGLIKDPTCKRCGASFLKKEGDSAVEQEEELLSLDIEEEVEDRQFVVCPRCMERQEIRDHCKWCGAYIGAESKDRGLLDIFKGKEEAPGPPGLPGEPKKPRVPGRAMKGYIFKAVAGIAVVYLIIVAGAYYFLKGSDVYRASRAFIEKSETVQRSVGEKVAYGPYPLFFSYDSDEGKGSFTYFVYGDRGAGIVKLELRKRQGKWTVVRGALWDRGLSEHRLAALPGP